MECCICLDSYIANKLPYVGSCGHSFCLDCWIKTSQISYYICPLCKKTMPLNDVIKNFLAVEFLEKDGILTMSGLLNEYKEFSEKLENKLEENKQLKDSIIELRRDRKDILEHYKQEAYESIIDAAEKKSNIIVKKTTEFSEKIIGETEQIILKMFLELEDSLKLMKDKLELYKDINILDL